MGIIDFRFLLSEIFVWSIDRFKNPYVISGIIVMVIGIILVIFSNKIAYKITLKMKDADDKKLANVGISVKVVASVWFSNVIAPLTLYVVILCPECSSVPSI